MYNYNLFEEEGINVYDLEYPDGSNPDDDIIYSFIKLCDQELQNGRAVAVHCRAGLGRTGTLIGLYIMYKYGWTAKQAIAWLRLCRPGSVVGEQQQFLVEMETQITQIMTHSHKKKFAEKAQDDEIHEQDYKFSQQRQSNYQPSPERKSIQFYDKTPPKKVGKKKGYYNEKHSDISSNSSKEEISGNSYIKEYYLRQYGSAKKGFKPEKEIKKRNASQLQEHVPQPKKLINFYNNEEKENERFKSP